MMTLSMINVDIMRVINVGIRKLKVIRLGKVIKISNYLHEIDMW